MTFAQRWNYLIIHFWEGILFIKQHMNVIVTSWSLTFFSLFFFFFTETHWGMGQNSLRIPNTQGCETTYYRYRTLWYWWSWSRIRCGHWPCLLFINQTLSGTPAKNFTLHMCSFCSNLVNQYKWPTKFQLFISKIFGKSIIWQKKRILFFFFCCYTKYSSNAFCSIFLPISISKCLSGAIINKLQHSYNNTVLNSLNPSPFAEQWLYLSLKDNLSFWKSQTWNLKRLPVSTTSTWSETQMNSLSSRKTKKKKKII